MRIEIPKLCVVALIGASGSGKSTFASKYFKSTEVLSSDYFRGMVSDDENDQSCSAAAFDALYYVAEKRLEAGKLVVIDATNVQSVARAIIVELAKKYHVFPTAIVLNTPEKICMERNQSRTDRNLGDRVIKNHCNDLKRSLKHLKKEGFRYIHVLDDPEEEVEILRIPSWTDKSDEHGPFDIIGDVHGCFDELCDLLLMLGYQLDRDMLTAAHPQGRKAVFLGDLIDRGPKIPQTLELVMNMVDTNNALCVPGNHDMKLLRKLKGSNVQITHGLQNSMEQLSACSQEFLERVKAFLDLLVGHYILDNGKLVVAHAGMKEKYQGRSSKRVRDFALYGDTTGETDAYGLPVRHDWAAEYRGKAFVVYGHTPTAEVYQVNKTANIDTGCVFGGKLTACRYPEREFISAPAKKVYYEPAKPLEIKEEYTDVLNSSDVLDKRYIETQLYGGVLIKEENAAAALEIMSRFAADPHWLIYLPPTMSPCETSALDGYLEHPLEAFEYYRKHGVDQVICERKHMGSRAVIIVCRNNEVAKTRFGVNDGRTGIIYTRTGRHFFNDEVIEEVLLERVKGALTETGFWTDFHTDWVCLDTELMPWSAKAQVLLEEQYAPTGRAGRNGLTFAVEALESAVAYETNVNAVDPSISGQNVSLGEVLARFRSRKEMLDYYANAYRQYCWNVESMEDYRIAPFHILAAEDTVFAEQNHVWHMDMIKKYMVHNDPIMMATDYMMVDLADENSVQAGVVWWENLTISGGEGMVVKPFDFIARNKGNLLQPAVKCRGREYLRIIYGAEYTMPQNLKRLKKRSLSRKRALALKEFSLGITALERFVKKEPLYRTHECVFGVLALESEPVDPRL